MTQRRFYVPRDLIQEDAATLPPGQAHHLRDVLRMRSGDEVEIFDGTGSGYVGEVDIRGPEVRIHKLSPIPGVKSPFRLTLAAALIKPARFEWMLEKATELGVEEIVPLITRLSDTRIPLDRMEARIERWKRILIEAARQCNRFAAPRIGIPRDFSDFISGEDFSGCTKVLFYEKAVEPWHAYDFLSDRIVACIGPEGGWDRGEIEKASSAGCRICSLGPWTLRAETAAIAAISIIQHQLVVLPNHNP